jgi:hypothetical protein
MDRVHDRCGPVARPGPQWTMSGVDKGRDGASPVHCA